MVVNFLGFTAKAAINDVQGVASDLDIKSNVMRGCWLSYIDTRQPGSNNLPVSHPDGKDIHQASIAVQGPGGIIDGWDIAGNIILPIYGKGLWSTMLGYLSLEPDGTTVKGLRFYAHA